MDWWMIAAWAVGAVVGWTLREVLVVRADRAEAGLVERLREELRQVYGELRRLRQQLDDRPFQEPFTLQTSGPMGELLSQMVYTPSPTPPSASSTAPPAPEKRGYPKPGPTPTRE